MKTQETLGGIRVRRKVVEQFKDLSKSAICENTIMFGKNYAHVTTTATIRELLNHGNVMSHKQINDCISFSLICMDELLKDESIPYETEAAIAMRCQGIMN